MKFLNVIVLLALLQSVGVSEAVAAKWDSVGVFLRPQKSVILINESRANSWPGSKIHQLMDVMNVATDFAFLSQDESIKLSCGRNVNAAICTFRFYPSSGVRILGKEVEAKIALSDLELAGFRTVGVGALNLEFQNSNGDVVMILGDSSHLVITGRKR